MKTLGRSLPYAVQNGRHKAGVFQGFSGFVRLSLRCKQPMLLGRLKVKQ